MRRNWIHILALAIFVTAGHAWALGITQGTGIEARIQDQTTFLNNVAVRGGDASVAQQLSTTFGVSTDALVQEKSAFQATWSDVFLAHTIQANTKSSATVGQLLQMRASGMTWTQIARNFHMSAGRFQQAIQIEARTMGRATTGLDGKIQSRVDFLNQDAQSRGDQTVAQRLSTQFGVGADVLLQEKARFQADWSDLFLAHTIQANSRTAVTVDQLLRMRTSRMTWTQIAHSVNFPAGRLSQAVRMEARNAAQISAGGSSSTSGRTGLTTGGMNGKIEERLTLLNSEAARLGDQTVAERLSTQFGVSTSALLQEKSQFQATWSDLFLAHTIQQSSKTSVTVSQLLQMRSSGMTWTQIARGTGVPQGRLMQAVRTGTRTETFVRAGTRTETFDTEGATTKANAKVNASAAAKANAKAIAKATAKANALAKANAKLNATGGACGNTLISSSKIRGGLSTTAGATARLNANARVMNAVRVANVKVIK